MSFPIETERLSLRPLEDGDLQPLVRLLGDGEVMKRALYGRALTPAEAREFIDDCFARDATAIDRLAILCRRADGAMLGFAGLLPCKYIEEELELGFVLDGKWQRQGFAPEIGKKLLDVGFTDLRRQRLFGLCDPENLASHKLLERDLGMQHVEEIATADRGPRLVFAITRSVAC